MSLVPSYPHPDLDFSFYHGITQFLQLTVVDYQYRDPKGLSDAAEWMLRKLRERVEDGRVSYFVENGYFDGSLEKPLQLSGEHILSLLRECQLFHYSSVRFTVDMEPRTLYWKRHQLTLDQPLSPPPMAEPSSSAASAAAFFFPQMNDGSEMTDVEYSQFLSDLQTRQNNLMKALSAQNKRARDIYIGKRDDGTEFGVEATERKLLPEVFIPELPHPDGRKEFFDPHCCHGDEAVDHFVDSLFNLEEEERMRKNMLALLEKESPSMFARVFKRTVAEDELEDELEEEMLSARVGELSMDEISKMDVTKYSQHLDELSSAISKLTMTQATSTAVEGKGVQASSEKEHEMKQGHSGQKEEEELDDEDLFNLVRSLSKGERGKFIRRIMKESKKTGEVCKKNKKTQCNGNAKVTSQKKTEKATWTKGWEEMVKKEKKEKKREKETTDEMDLHQSLKKPMKESTIKFLEMAVRESEKRGRKDSTSKKSSTSSQSSKTESELKKNKKAAKTTTEVEGAALADPSRQVFERSNASETVRYTIIVPKEKKTKEEEEDSLAGLRYHSSIPYSGEELERGRLVRDRHGQNFKKAECGMRSGESGNQNGGLSLAVVEESPCVFLEDAVTVRKTMTVRNLTGDDVYYPMMQVVMSHGCYFLGDRFIPEVIYRHEEVDIEVEFVVQRYQEAMLAIRFTDGERRKTLSATTAITIQMSDVDEKTKAIWNDVWFTEPYHFMADGEDEYLGEMYNQDETIEQDSTPLYSAYMDGIEPVEFQIMSEFEFAVKLLEMEKPKMSLIDYVHTAIEKDNENDQKMSDSVHTAIAPEDTLNEIIKMVCEMREQEEEKGDEKELKEEEEKEGKEEGEKNEENEEEEEVKEEGESSDDFELIEDENKELDDYAINENGEADW